MGLMSPAPPHTTPSLLACLAGNRTHTQVKWAKLRGTPGSPPEKLAEAEREVNEAETRLRDTKIAYEVRARGVLRLLHRGLCHLPEGHPVVLLGWGLKAQVAA